MIFQASERNKIKTKSKFYLQAAQYGATNALHWLLEKGADANAQDSKVFDIFFLIQQTVDYKKMTSI